MRIAIVALLAALLVAAGAQADTNKSQTTQVPSFSATPTADGDMCPTAGASPLCEYSGSQTIQYLGFHRGSAGTVTTWGPMTVQTYRGVQGCAVGWLNAPPSNCTVPNITIEESYGDLGATPSWHIISSNGASPTFTGATGPTSPVSYDPRAVLGPRLRATLAADIIDTDCDSGGVGLLDLVVVCTYGQ